MKEIILIIQIALSFSCAFLILFHKTKTQREGAVSAVWCAAMLLLGFYGVTNWPNPMSIVTILSTIAAAASCGYAAKKCSSQMSHNADKA